MSLTAQDVLSNIDVIRNSLIVEHFNVTVDYTSTTAPNVSIPSTLKDQNGNTCSDYLGSAPLLLHSLTISYGSNFQADYSVYTKLPGLNIDNNSFNIPPASSSGFDYVPTGKKFLIPTSSTMDIYAYNSGGSSTSEVFNIFAIFEKLDTLSANQQALL